jgi:hypothetical protein
MTNPHANTYSLPLKSDVTRSFCSNTLNHQGISRSMSQISLDTPVLGQVISSARMDVTADKERQKSQLNTVQLPIPATLRHFHLPVLTPKVCTYRPQQTPPSTTPSRLNLPFTSTTSGYPPCPKSESLPVHRAAHPIPLPSASPQTPITIPQSIPLYCNQSLLGLPAFLLAAPSCFMPSQPVSLPAISSARP